MTIEEAKKLLPPGLKYPLPGDVIDNLINVTSIPDGEPMFRERGEDGRKEND